MGCFFNGHKQEDLTLSPVIGIDCTSPSDLPRKEKKNTEVDS